MSFSRDLVGTNGASLDCLLLRTAVCAHTDACEHIVLTAACGTLAGKDESEVKPALPYALPSVTFPFMILGCVCSCNNQEA